MQMPARVNNQTSLKYIIRAIAGSSQGTGLLAFCLALLIVAFSSSPIAAQATASPGASAAATSARVAQPPKAAVDAAKLVTEFEVNGLKVLVKHRESSQTAVVGLFLRGGATNIKREKMPALKR